MWTYCLFSVHYLLIVFILFCQEKKSVVSKNAAVITRNNSAFARECGDIMCMQWTNSQLLGVNVRFEGITYTVNIIIEAFIEQRVKGTFFAARCSQPVAATVVDF